MELLYLLWSIISNTFISFTLSLFLSFRRLFPHSTDATNSFALYQGTVWHERRRPVHHSFKYSVRYAFIDLDLAPHPPPDHLSSQQARDIAHTNGPVFLLTIPPSVGYEQNPLSLYYCYDVEGSTKCLKQCIAEVTNTPWGERVQFVFNPNLDVVAKPLHVSPFMDMHGKWSIKTSVPGDNLIVNISVNHPKLGDYFTASLTANRISSSSVQHAVFFWLMPHKVAIWIYWHALKLWWKKVVFIQHPRYENPSYKKDAIARDRNLGCCQAFSVQTDNQPQVEPNDRWIRWRDAKWPWC
ncbi:hypothetical protein HanXRQr2_Chr16g0768931 [Helianthus annuus]|uniref:DUF1365 domain-containing protein n=1 Tax=Helianthus annuus TaxID=4232 RepID=A0A251S2T8_HELAN|nr:uncharacterized protein LOC110918425 [Helianthus annuus]KAF5761766.1 hypothetical protein HanXRQr2_Chr16g0768931 [Helianthus annuus]KAJ0444683.1 hypothetical protein HanIR_Chr16g0834551 [Helianthus annuus]KAJ0461931.1 hypothetical protein HanHA89_Chr16g0677841 [Helianthus annuus]KAJ0642318.1 hypothetical protein HanLR1_Chr16g0636971 [Helianthus annuus]KAJ0646203.1 hypothetical protein HanOQP8_Chr16g0632521 [Helianthus annuus]